MSPLSVRIIRSVDELRSRADAWDDLWRRSASTVLGEQRPTSPLLRAEHVAQWVEHFAAQRPFRALVVEDDSRWLAALPLVERRRAGLVRLGVFPANEWSVSGGLLLDESDAARRVGACTHALGHGGCKPPPDGRTVADAALRRLVDARDELPWSAIKLDDIEPAAPRWRRLIDVTGASNVPSHYRRWADVGRIDTTGDWASFRASWSRRHRQQMSRHARRLARRGTVELQWIDRADPIAVGELLGLGFDIEHRGWKGRASTSVLACPGMSAFYRRQAEQLARHGELRLAFLRVGGEPIAFAYGMQTKGVYRSLKVGYDPHWSAYSPGQMLRMLVLERLFAEPDTRQVDAISPTPAHRQWRPEPYEIGRLLIATGGWPGTIAVRAARAWGGA